MSFRLKVEMHRGPLRLHIDRELPTDRITGVFGPSGAGKTTLLRCIAGFERPPIADIRFGKECWQDTQAGVFLPPHRRSVATVFQEPRLFPHLDVAGNLAYALKRGASQGPDYDEVVRLLGLKRLLDRKTSELSGGEARRVAVARALLRGPGMLLMDEPTANLDEHHKRELLRFLLRAQKSLGIPVIYVSHDIEELCWLVDDLLILEDGIVTGSGDLGAVLARANLPMIGRREAGVILEARVLDYDAETAVSRLQFDGGELLVAGKVAEGVQRLRVRADEVSLAIEQPRPSSILNVLKGTVREISQDQEASVLVAVDVGSSGLLARVSIRSSRELELQPGTPVYAQVKGIAVRDMSG